MPDQPHFLEELFGPEFMKPGQLKAVLTILEKNRMLSEEGRTLCYWLGEQWTDEQLATEIVRQVATPKMATEIPSR